MSGLMISVASVHLDGSSSGLECVYLAAFVAGLVAALLARR